MDDWRPSPLRNPANWYLLLGLCVLLLTAYVPWLAADRTTRVERRAQRLASLLAETTAEFGVPADADAAEQLAVRFQMRLTADGEFAADLVPATPTPGAWLRFTNKHYALQLQPSPPSPELMIGQGTVPAFEVVAWPLDGDGPGHSKFFFPEHAPRAFTRNLSERYRRRLAEPAPGGCHAVPGQGREGQMSYRSADDERWLLY